jgi:hypothetical protein
LEVSTGKKVRETPCQQTSQAQWYTSVIPATKEAEEGRLRSEAWAKMPKTISEM